MSVAQGHLTEAQIEKNFDAQVQQAIDTGTMPDSETGLNIEVQKAIVEIAREYPYVTAVSIQNAKQAYRRQVSGAAGADATASVRAIAATLGYSLGDSLA